VDGRVISVPLAWSWRLSDATPQQRANFRLIGTGQGIHWPDVDEDISVDGMLYGAKGSIVITLDPDIAAVFPGPERRTTLSEFSPG
jgi:hypothetical protein